ncbi:MAG: SGNH/GDSL hydrolase family protein [Spirochaetes bacterium]|nr:SGNH/GDSL hydrolase family protein [Spirochaetota bacterium]
MKIWFETPRRAVLLSLLLASMGPRLHPARVFPVDSPAATWSPGNWAGDEGRGGAKYRQAWNTGAYMRWTWQSGAAQPSATLLLDDRLFPEKYRRPSLAYAIDGIWRAKVPVTNELEIVELRKASGPHELFVVLTASRQQDRWGAPGMPATNALRIEGLRVDDESRPVERKAAGPWALILGDSITEGIGGGELAGYGWLLGQSLAGAGWEFCQSACGWSGWLAPGDNPRDVPGYYVITNGADGAIVYLDAASRWNKIDGDRHSLLDANGHLSGWGQVNQEPALIFINYGTNDKGWYKGDGALVAASIRRGLAALRGAAPRATILVMIPFNQAAAADLKAAVEERQKGGDALIHCIDLGQGVARALSSPTKPLGDLHPNDAGYAWLASLIIPRVFTRLGLRVE